MATKKKVTAEIAVETREDMEALVGELCKLAIQKDTVMDALDKEVQTVRERHEAKIVALETAYKARLELAKAWAVEHVAEFGTAKSLVMVHGTIGFRTGNPTLAPIKGLTWDEVLDLLEKSFPEYVRRKTEVDRELLIAQREKLGEDGLRKRGVRVQQREAFYFWANREGALS